MPCDFTFFQAAALLNPSIVAQLEAAGKFDANNSLALDHAFHRDTGAPVVQHIHQLAARHDTRNHPNFAKLEQQSMPPAIEGNKPATALPAPETPDGQKKSPNERTYPGQKRLDTAQEKSSAASDGILPNESNPSEVLKNGKSIEETAEDALSHGKLPVKAGLSKVTMAKVGGSILGSILIADQLHRANREPGGDKNEKSTKVIHYIAATAAAAGIGLLIFTKPEKLVRFAENISSLIKATPSKT